MTRKGNKFHERTPLLSPLLSRAGKKDDRGASWLAESRINKEQQALGGSTVGERNPFQNYVTIDWLHDLVKDSYRHRIVHGSRGVRQKLYASFDSAAGWIAAILIGVLTAAVGLVVDTSEATISDWKFGVCKRNPFLSRDACCDGSTPMRMPPGTEMGVDCDGFRNWSHEPWAAFAAYAGFACLFGVIASALTMTTKASLPAAAPRNGTEHPDADEATAPPQGKTMYMAAGSGIPEIKTILSGFNVPHFLGRWVLVVKAVGASFAVPSTMSLGKEGPFIHISACIGNLVASMFEKYRHNPRKFREMLAASVAAGLSAAFGAPIGGVLFAYEEIATYFPRSTLWRAFVCSAVAAIILRTFNPSGSGKLILYETHYGTSYMPSHYLAFVIIGVAGGVWGGLFCKWSFAWGRWFRAFKIIKEHPVLEVLLVVLVSVVVQYPNPLTRVSGERIIKNNLVDCLNDSTSHSWMCKHESDTRVHWSYIGWLVHGCVAKLVLTIASHGTKIPAGLIIPALGAGSFFGRLLGQSIQTISPGIFAMVGAGAFLAGISKMTISLCVIMLELTGEMRYILPHMIAIMVAKWVSDLISAEGVYDLTMSQLGHPFLDETRSMNLVRKQDPPHTLRRLVPSMMAMDEMTVKIDKDNATSRQMLETKLNQLKSMGLLDGGLAIVKNDGMLQGFIGEGELEYGLHEVGKMHGKDCRVRLLGQKWDAAISYSPQDEERPTLVNETVKENEVLDLRSFVDRAPISLCEVAPMEFAMEYFSKLGVRHILIVQEGTSKLLGVVSRKRFVAYIEGLD